MHPDDPHLFLPVPVPASLLPPFHRSCYASTCGPFLTIRACLPESELCHNLQEYFPGHPWLPPCTHSPGDDRSPSFLFQSQRPPPFLLEIFHSDLYGSGQSVPPMKAWQPQEDHPQPPGPCHHRLRTVRHYCTGHRLQESEAVAYAHQGKTPCHLQQQRPWHHPSHLYLFPERHYSRQGLLPQDGFPLGFRSCQCR